MPKLVRVHDPAERSRRLPLVIQEDLCPGLIQFLGTLDYGTETPLVRGVLYQWYLQHRDAGTIETAVASALAGPGGGAKRKRSGSSKGANDAPVPSLQAATREPKPVAVDPVVEGRPAASVPAATSGTPVPGPDEIANLSLLESMFN